MLMALQQGPMVWIWLEAVLINAVLIAIAQQLPLLTKPGWVHAAALGTILWGCLGWRGWLAVVIYLGLGSLVTRLGFRDKQRRGLAEGRGGCRGPENVWGSAAVGAVMALLIGAGFEPNQLLFIGFSASFAAKLADTFGSEIGKRWGRTTVMITTLRPVPAGTDGAVSLEGTLASAVGSLVMTLPLLLLGLLPSVAAAVVVSLVGLLATLAESLLGALVQDKISWLTNEVINGLQTLIAAILAIFLAAIFLPAVI